MKKIIIILILIIYYIVSDAQQVYLTDFSYLNPYINNPAKAGEKGGRLFFINRQQWKSIPGAPETSILSFDTELKGRNVGIGAIVSLDNNNFINKNSISVTYKYKLKVGNNHYLSFALSPSIISTQIDFTKVITEQIDDPLLFSTAQSSLGFNADAGLNYKYKGFQFGFSALNLTAPKLSYYSQVDNISFKYQLVQFFSGNLLYTFSFLDNDLQLEPSIIGWSTIGLPLQIDGGLNVFYKDIVFSRIGYRHNSNIYMALAFNLYEELTVGCGYEYSIGQLSGYSGGTYEVIIGYKFNQRAYDKFDNSYSKNKKEAKRIRENIEVQSQKLDELLYNNSELEEKIEKNTREINSIKEEIDNLKNDAKLSEEDLEILKKIQEKHDSQDNYEYGTENLNSSMQEDNNNNILHYNNDTTNYDIIKDNINCHLIVGAYRNIENAKIGQKILLREINLKTTIIQDAAKYFYFISSGTFDNQSDILDEKQRLHQLNIENYIIGFPWVYYIND